MRHKSPHIVHRPFQNLVLKGVRENESVNNRGQRITNTHTSTHTNKLRESIAATNEKRLFRKREEYG